MNISKKLIMPLIMVIVVAFSISVGLVAASFNADNPTAWGFFTLMGVLLVMILFTWGRQIWWFISGTGDYYGRVGLLKSLWLRIFKK